MDGDDHVAAALAVTEATPGSAKRKRSPSADASAAIPAPPAKAMKTHNSSHLQINYLARQYSDILPLVSCDDTLPVVLQLLSDYAGVLERHESLASNLGARPLGPILIQRFERLFDGQPRVLKSHGKEVGSVTWLDVVEFARQKPEQFNLEKTRDGIRVCQFYTKQCRVEISEDDFTLIASGLPQKLIPPQPISEDEEKELGTLEILEKRITSLIQLADQVSARARQTKHRVTSRRNAIASRREAEQIAERNKAGDGDISPHESASGFRPVNNRPEKLNGLYGGHNSRLYTGSTASPTTHAELLSCFSNNRQRSSDGPEFVSPTSARPGGGSGSGSGSGGGNGSGNGSGGGGLSSSKSKVKPLGENIDYAGILLSSASPGPIPSTPSTTQNQPQRASQAERYDDSGPFKSEMLSRMENMARGERVMPPCDRCRRLHMDCLKNLTACLGCTKKHAKCSWKEVNDQELAENPFPHPRTKTVGDALARRGSGDELLGSGAAAGAAGAEEDPSQPVRDEELLGEDDSDDELPHSPPLPTAAAPTAAPVNGGHGAPSPAASSPRDDGPPSAASSMHSLRASPKLATTTAVDGKAGSEDYKISPIEAMPPERVEQAAREILEKRIEERGGSLAGSVNGFRSVNRPMPADPLTKAESDEVSNGVVKQPSVVV